MAVITGEGVLEGTDADDQITGGSSNDTLLGGGGNDLLDGGSGFDFTDYSTSAAGVRVRLSDGTVNDGLGGTDTLSGLEGVIGSAWGDTILGSDLTDVLLGADGDDAIHGLDGDDALSGNGGNDQIDGGAGTDTFYGGGDRANYSVTAIAGGFTIVDNRAPGGENDGADTVTGVEFFAFNDGVFSAANLLDPSANHPTAQDDMLIGTAGGDRIDAFAGNDTVNGAGGDDTLTGGAGDDVLDGGSGYDIALISDVGFRGVDTGAAAGTLTITSTAGTDILSNVELVLIADGRLVMDENDPAARVARLYEAALDRLPDQGGLNFWIDAVQEGASLSTLAGGFIESAEFRSRFGEMASNAAYVDRLYLNVLDRAGEAEGRAHWVGVLERGALSRAEVLVAFSESAENRAGTAALVQAGIWDRSEAATEVARLYDTVFGRLPDISGLVAWKTWLENGSVILAQVADSFAQSAEFRGQFGDLGNRDFADALYVNALDRPADAAGLNHWARVLDSGAATRAEVVLAFSESAEHVALTTARIQSENPGEYGIVFV